MNAEKVALITGCSSGIGRDLAARMTDAGYRVVATARKQESLAGLEVAMKLALDVTDDASVANAIDQVLARFGRIDVLVNNAGFSAMGAIEELSHEVLVGMYEVNVFGAARMLRAVAPSMRKQRSGKVVNISSLVGLMSVPVNGGYASTKFAIEALSDAARQELAPFGVDVVVVEPGSIRTRFADAMLARSTSVLSNAESPYRELYERNDALNSRMREGEAPVFAVSDVVLRALSARRPRPRYAAAIPLAARLLSRLSAGLRDRIWTAALSRAGA